MENTIIDPFCKKSEENCNEIEICGFIMRFRGMGNKEEENEIED
jgi:hypothetical protein